MTTVVEAPEDVVPLRDGEPTAPRPTRGRTRRSTGLEAAREPLPAPPDGFRGDIQGMRGVAVTVIAAYHAEIGPSGGFSAIQLFFVLSGYVIALVVLTELRDTGTLSLRDFFARRIRRLAPMLGLFAVTTTAASAFVLDNDVVRRAGARTAFAAATIHANLQLEAEGGGYFSPAADLNPFLHTWSLSVEEQFYLVLPLLVLGMWRLGRRSMLSSQLLQVAVGVLGAASLVLAAATVASGDERAAFYLTHLRAWEFALGVLLALVAHHVARIGRRTASALAVVGAVLVGGSFVLLDQASTWPGLPAVPICVGSALVIAAGIGDERRTPVNRVLAARPLQWLGDRSYGWYLWHWPAIVFARVLLPERAWALPAAAVAALGLTALTYRLVEQPFRRQRAITGLAAVVVFAVAAQIPAAVAGVVSRDADIALRPVDGEFAAFTRAWSDGCTDLGWDPATCTYGVEDAGGTVLLLGDSTATALSDAVTAASASLGMETVVRTVFGCPVLPRGIVDGGEEGGDECRRYQEQASDLVHDLQPDLVVVSHRSPYWVRPGEARTLQRPDGTPVEGPDEALAEWRDGLAELLADVEAPVVLVAMVPELDEGLADVVARGDVDDPRTVIERAAVEARRAEVLAVERAVAAADGATLVVDPVPLLCEADVCRARTDDDRWRYHDSHHLRAYASAPLIPAIADGMLDVLGGLDRDSNG